MGYWKSKVLPQIKKVFDPSGKKAAAADFFKSFDGSKEEISKEVEEKKTELQPRVLEIYEASSTEIKALVKGQGKESGVKKNSAAVTKFLQELVKIEFPGSKTVSEAAAKSGPALVSGPVLFIFQKVSAFLPAEAAPKEVPSAEPASAVEETARGVEAAAAAEEQQQEEIEKSTEEATHVTEPGPAEPAAEEPAPEVDPPKA